MREGWKYCKLGDVSSFSRGLTYSKNDVAEESSKKVLRSNNIDLASHSLNFDDVACLKEGFVIPSDKKLHQNDIFICMSNGSTQHLGKVAFIEKDLDYAFGGFMGAIHPQPSAVYPKFAFYYCMSAEYRKSLASVLNGININNLKWSDISKFPIPIPPISEQQRIVSELDLLSNIIERKKAQLIEYDQLAQSIFNDMFGDPVTNEKGWEVKKYKEFAEIVGGYAFNSEKFVDSGVPVLKIGNINAGVLKLEGICYYPYTPSLKRYEVHSGDLVISLTGTTGKDDYGNICIIPNYVDTFYLNQRNALLKPNATCNNIFLQYVFKQRTIKEILTKNNHGVRQANILNKDIMNLSIPLPLLSLQQSFAEKIEAIEKQKELIKQSIAETETMFNSRMDYYFN